MDSEEMNEKLKTVMWKGRKNNDKKKQRQRRESDREVDERKSYRDGDLRTSKPYISKMEKIYRPKSFK